MNTIPLIALCVPIGVCIFLIIKLISVKKGAREIAVQTERILKEDTNGQITLSTGDRDMRSLASAVNTRLSELRKEELTFRNGDRELKKAITNISHDLRTPLTSILGYVQMAKNEENPQKCKEYLSIIGGRAEKMKELTEELFAYALLTSPEKELMLTPVDIRSPLEESIAENFLLLTDNGIKPEISIPDIPVVRNTDPAALQRVFTNIISNAAKYSDGDLTVNLNEAGEAVFINTAKNLTETETGKLFDRFYTVEDGRKSTGLGLSIAKYLTEKMNGKISAEYMGGKLKITVSF